MAQGTPFLFTRNAAVAPRQGTPFLFTRNAAVAPRQGTPFTFVRGAPIVVSGSSTFHIVRGEEVPVPNRGSSTFHIVRGEESPIPNRGSATFQSLRDTLDVTNGLIRGPQFRSRTIADDRFNNRLTTILSTTSAINLTSAGITPIFTVPTGNMALIQGVILLATTVAQASTNATISLGINPSTTNLFDSQELVQFRVTNDVFSLWSDKSTTLVAQAGEQIDLDITIAASGTLTADAYLIGFLI